MKKQILLTILSLMVYLLTVGNAAAQGRKNPAFTQYAAQKMNGKKVKPKEDQ